MEQPSSQDSLFLTLDDKSLQKVFQFLKLSDLCNTADSCKRFKKNATEVFKSKFTDLNILELINGETHFHDEWFMVPWQADQFLKRAEHLLLNFGQHINTLQLTGSGEKGGMNENELLLLVKKHCSSLKELTLHDIGSSDDFDSTELISLFNSLEKLSVDSDGDLCDSFAALFADCHELKYLNASYVPATMWVEHKFPKLDTLVISNNWEFDYDKFESFLQRHQNLRTLSYQEGDVSPELFTIIANASPRLENFHCDIFGICCDESDQHEMEQNILQLSKFKSMRNLTISCEESVMNLLIGAFHNEDTPIENFGILDCKIDEELIAGISKLKWLRTLKLKECSLNEKAFVKVNESLNRLNQVTIEDMKGFDLDGHHLLLANNVRVTRHISKKVIQDQDPLNILNTLNDDCLLAIFQYLPLSDLCTVADVCRTFKENAQTSFQLHYSILNTEKITEVADNGIHADMQMAERLFRNFGHLIRELCVNRSRNHKAHERIMHLANKYCSSEGLKSLAFCGIHFKDEMRLIMPLLNMFIRLEKLELSSCYLSENFGKFLSCCHISQIYVHSASGGEWMNNQFRYSASMVLFDMWMPESAIKKFIKLNGHLQLLAIENINISSHIFRTVAKHMYRLEALSFSGRCPMDRRVRQNVLHLAKLKNLKRLKLNCSRFSLGSLIDAFDASTHLTELHINFGTADMQLLEKLSNLQSSIKSLALKRLKLKDITLNDVVMKMPDLDDLEIDIQGIDVKDIITMLPLAQKLTKLSICSIKSDVKIDISNYESILLIVKCRRIAKSLHICITSEDSHVSVPQHLLQENEYWLKIENEIFDDLRSVMSDSDSEHSELQEDSSDEEDLSDEEDSSEESSDSVTSEKSVDD